MQHKTFTINGVIENGSKIKISLLSFDSTNATLILDTTISDNKGNFILKTLSTTEELYAIKIENNPEIWLTNDAAEISIKIDNANYKTYKITGSKNSEELHLFINNLDSLLANARLIKSTIDTLLKHRESDSIISIKRKDYNLTKNNISNYCKTAVATTNNPALKYFYLFYTYKSNLITDNDLFKLVLSSSNTFPNHVQLLGLKNTIGLSIKTNPKLFLINEPAFDFNYLGLDSSTLNLKSFDGKYVLLDFWESGNKTYREQVPYFTETYKQFKNKNFEILSISIDSNFSAWKKTIKQDSLVWKHTIDTFRFNSEVLKKYFVKSIPFNILINPQRKIIAVDLRKYELREKLREILN